MSSSPDLSHTRGSRRAPRRTKAISNGTSLSKPPSRPSFSSRTPLRKRRRRLLMLGALSIAAASYLSALTLLLTNQRAQNALIFLHWIRPPFFLRIAPLDNLVPWRLAGHARIVTAASGIRGWHLLPPGPPYPPSDVGKTGGSSSLSSSARDRFFDSALRSAGARVVIFFHGNSGHRAFPFKRVEILRFLASHLGAHVVTFDYAGFGDSPGRPSEHQLYRDARAAFDWVISKVDPATADIVIYGQSLGTFASSHLASSIVPRADDGSDGGGERNCSLAGNDGLTADVSDALRAVVLDAPPASVVDAAMTHPSCRIFRFLPRLRQMASWALRRCALDNIRRVSEMHARLPVLILHGSDDSFIPIDQGRKVYEAACSRGKQTARFVEFPGVGHVNVNAARNYLHELTSFLDEQWRPAARRQVAPLEGVLV